MIDSTGSAEFIEIKISVIIPAYNIRNYIGNCLSSVLKQSYQNLEIIVVDDGSNDGTAEYLDDFARFDHRIRVVHQENGGVTRARLRGVREATGEYIGFVDGDDEIDEDMYERLLANALKYHADISHCGYKMVFPSRSDDYYNTGRLVTQDGLTGQKDLLEGSFIEPGLWNKLFCRELFDQLLQSDLMDADIRNTEDLLMNYYLFREASSAVYEDFCPYHYIVRADSAANKSMNEHQLKDPLRVFEILVKETADTPQLHEIMKRRQLTGLIMAATIDTKNQPDFVRTYRAQMRKKLRGMLPGVLRGSEYCRKLKMKAAFAGICPSGYGCLHTIYAKLTGLDKIYEIK